MASTAGASILPTDVTRAAHAPGTASATASASTSGPGLTVPVPLTSFVGRGREVEAVQHLLMAARLLTLTGPGGVGKTRLAMRLAQDLDTDNAFPDGVRFVGLAPLTDAALVPHAIAAALGVGEEAGRPLLAAVHAALRPRRLLLVLDNCEHLVEACARVADALLQGCPRLTILATSREALNLAGEAVWPVPPLAVPAPAETWAPDQLLGYDAIRLFVERAGNAVPGFALTDGNAAAAVEICTRLDGLPLAIELAAARVRVLGPDQIAARLGDRFRLLTGGSRTALARHQTLRAAVDWSYALLTEPERTLFTRVAVFAGDWTLAAAEAVGAGGGIAPDGVLDLLARLVDKSLVVADAADSGTARYHLLETLRQYGRERLDASGTREGEAARDRHLTYYLALAEDADARIRHHPREQDEWLRRLDRETDNLRTALAWSVARDPAAGLRLATGLLWLWWYRRRHLEGVQWLETLLARAPAPADDHSRARALLGIGHLYREYGDLDRARTPLTEALACFAALGDRDGEATALARLALLHAGEGRLPEARRCAEESLALFRALGASAEVAIGLNQLGLLAAQAGDFAAASRWHGESLALARRAGDRFRIMRQLYLLGAAVRVLGDHPRARRLFAEAAALLEPDDPWSWSYQWIYPADLASDEGAYDEAGRLYREALTHLQQVGWRIGVSWVVQRLGMVAIRTGDADRGVRLLAAAHDIGRGTAPHYPELPHERGAAVERARDSLGEKAFQAAWAAGQALTLEDAAAEALAVVPWAGVRTGDAPAGAPDDAPGLLTARQREVAALIAQGLTNRQIAERLVVSPHTVERHVEHILGRLGLTSRTQIAAWAGGRGHLPSLGA